MSRFVEGDAWGQATSLPGCLDDYIAEGNPVRAVDAFVEELARKRLRLAGADPAATGRPAYHPAALLELNTHGRRSRIP
jgi:transposase